MKRPRTRIDLENFISYRLAVISGAWGAASERFYRRHFGLALREWRVLAVLSRFGASGVAAAGEIARLTSVGKGGISRALASLERRRLVAREWSDEDGRRSTVRLTGRGRALLQRLAPAALARQAALVSALTPRERRTFFGLLDKVERRVAELAADPGGGARKKYARRPGAT